eukprot:3748497-Alexandrium_andersonii.AAC.1
MEGGGPDGKARPRSIPRGEPLPASGPKPGGGGFAATASAGTPPTAQRPAAGARASLRRAEGGAFAGTDEGATAGHEVAGTAPSERGGLPGGGGGCPAGHASVSAWRTAEAPTEMMGDD